MRKGTIVAGVFLSWFATAAVSTSAFAQLPPLLPPPPRPVMDKLDPLVQYRALQTTGHSRVIVRAVDAASLGAVAVLIRQVGGTLGRQLLILNAQVADVPNVSLAILSNSLNIQRIALDRVAVGGNDRTSATIGATSVRQQYGYNGAGIVVLVIEYVFSSLK